MNAVRQLERGRRVDQDPNAPRVRVYGERLHRLSHARILEASDQRDGVKVCTHVETQISMGIVSDYSISPVYVPW